MWWPRQKVRPAQLDRARARRAEAHAAAEHLVRVEPRFAPLVQRYGLERPITTRNPFAALLGSIVQQQISMSAAHAVLQRVRALCPRGRLTPAAIGALRSDRLRRAGLSRQKALYVRELARSLRSGEITARRLRALPDEEVIALTTQVHGIGRWTAEMLLISCLERPDVWPVDDLGLRKGAMRFWEMPEAPTPKALVPHGDALRPFRSYATWYLWRSLEGPLMPGISVD
ncbi:MAG: DNA-3-methyladenine glycosylase 2 family protein [Phycisphaerales bacterium]|nr:DNA-3-methyladenine glycosylase 2 family protein [Phycisphaerales bacterium]